MFKKDTNVSSDAEKTVTSIIYYISIIYQILNTYRKVLFPITVFNILGIYLCVFFLVFFSFLLSIGGIIILKMTKTVQKNRENQKVKRVKNFMNGNSYELTNLETLKLVTASSIFGEPQYYRHGEFAQKKVIDGMFRIHPVAKEYSILGSSYENMKTSDLMERIIDEALDTDFDATLDWAVTLRQQFQMRLNPQIIMVRASIHPNRQAYTEKHPGKFKEINQLVMSRGDEPASQLTYWLYKEGSKKSIPSVLKRSWKEKIESLSRYQVSKYKHTHVGLIDTVRISHAKGSLVDELMKTGTVAVNSSDATWEQLRSKGDSWKSILETITIPHMALLRNLRNIFTEIDDLALCQKIMEQLKGGVLKGKQFPFRYYTAMKAVHSADVHHKSVLLDALEECIDIARENMPKLKGKTISLSDNSGSAWGTFNSEYGSVTVAEIDNLSSVLTAQNSEDGYVGIFGDRLEIVPISKRNGALSQTTTITEKGQHIGGGTENGIWLFFDQAIKKKEHWDNIFIYSDQQAGHGGLYGINSNDYKDFAVGGGWSRDYIDVLKLVNKYRAEVNPKVNVFSVQTAGYNNVVIPETLYRGGILYGWTGKETVYADALIKTWDDIENKKQN